MPGLNLEAWRIELEGDPDKEFLLEGLTNGLHIENSDALLPALFEIKAFLSAAADSKCFLLIQLAKMCKLSAPSHQFIPAAKTGSDSISDAHLQYLLIYANSI